MITLELLYPVKEAPPMTADIMYHTLVCRTLISCRKFLGHLHRVTKYRIITYDEGVLQINLPTV